MDLNISVTAKETQNLGHVSSTRDKEHVESELV
uniref:Uncharacterized protein n=1 Tax=Arundo donax TaxID=35708 RepID=A0A0A9E7P1_ARUDO